MFQPYDVDLLTDTDAAHRARTPPSLGGDDFAYGLGNPIVSPGPGVVDLVDRDSSGSGGRMVGVRHAGGVRSEQLHASRLDVEVGQLVEEGEDLGLSGGSAYDSEHGVGYHIHAHFTVNGVRVGWLNYLASIGAATASGGFTPLNTTTTERAAFDMSAFILSSGIGQTFVIDDDVFGFEGPDDVRAVSGAPVVGVSNSMHVKILTRLEPKLDGTGLPIIVNVPEGNGTIYMLTGGKLVPLADPRTVHELTGKGAVNVTLSLIEAKSLLDS